MTAMSPIHDHRPFLFVPTGVAEGGERPAAGPREARMPALADQHATQHTAQHTGVPASIAVPRRRFMGVRPAPGQQARAVGLAAGRMQAELPMAAGDAEADTPRALHRAWAGVRRVAAQAVQRRMRTEMADLASRIRRLHDIEPR